ncbi:MAG: hypothetical protein JO061_17905 [Acidobacteriaceae bacterium]|nr:hypothetical protein [Acidobacteriaceae bacterium]
MFERYEESARRVIFFARYETSTLGGDYIEPEHLLLGLLRECQVIKSMFPGGAIESLRRELEQRSRNEIHHQTSVDIPLSNGAKRVLAYGAEEAERMNDRMISCAHLAAGILREPETFASQWLVGQGVTLERLRETMINKMQATRTNDDIVNRLRVELREAVEQLDWTIAPALRVHLR